MNVWVLLVFAMFIICLSYLTMATIYHMGASSERCKFIDFIDKNLKDAIDKQDLNRMHFLMQMAREVYKEETEKIEQKCLDADLSGR